MKTHRLTRLVATLGAGSLAFGLAACGSDNAVPTSSNGASSPEDATASSEQFSGSIAGAGASSQEAAMNAWIATYKSGQPDVTVSYEPVGSGAGITQFLDKQVLWAGSDAPLEGEEVDNAKARCGGNDAIDLPVYISPVAVIFNIPGVSDLALTPDTIAKIFSGDITNWSDPAIAETNEGVDLPDMTITPVHRADKSGTTENFTDYLAKAAPQAWPHEPNKSWPISGGESGDKTSGLVQAVAQGEGTIGYADASQAGSLGTVALKAGDGFVQFSNESAAKAVDAATRVDGRADGDLALNVSRTPDDPGAYPLVLVSYSIVCTAYEEQSDVDLVKSFISYQVSPEGQEAAAGAAGSAPLSDDMRDNVLASLDLIKVAK